MDASHHFAENFVRTRYGDLSESVIEATKKEILDLLGVAVGGSSEPGAKELLEIVLDWEGKEESTIIGCGKKVPAPNAGHVNATMAHALDYDDVHESAVMHPGITIIPTCMSIAERIGGISGKDFIRLNHATYYADIHVLISAMESISKELEKRKAPQRKGPNIMLVGSTMAEGDYKVLDLLEEAGANIVIEEFSEGVRHYQQRIEPNGDLIRALADRYLRRRVPPAMFHGVIKNRFDYLLKLVKEFKVSGVVWYSLMYRDSYDREGLLFSQVLKKERGIPLLKLNSDYDIAESGPMRTRIETFIEIVKQRG